MNPTPTWSSLIAFEQQQDYFQHIRDFLQRERVSGKVIYPAEDNVLSAFEATEFSRVKVVILGQDPYHGAGQAHGLAFSVLPGVKIPPSLKNIYKELSQDIEGFSAPNHGYLQHWANQGVLLLNTVLTVEEGKAHSHAKIGWEQFTDAMISALNSQRDGLVFLLWGAHAQKKGQAIDATRHHILTSVHPSPLSARRGFFGCGHFSQTNQYLTGKDMTPIDWRLPQTVECGLLD
ncbi:uracil-DNA glycosylase [Vibrio sp. SM6]|uniref:Uracil-DNA glycosylase n=1 Tax=Vibrio agarilyticus TaxID=2726741 RepID=A0A7X8YFT9_9VIBR|nr:uracil-DNA glycosylase [Vibrio agarilyticus]NLS12263.1 uracil-DNA glycosylase [Vibrio agarilyticus]